jgi:hypothetical protein
MVQNERDNAKKKPDENPDREQALAASVGIAAVRGNLVAEPDSVRDAESTARAPSGARLVRTQHGAVLVYSPPRLTKEEDVTWRVQNATMDITDPSERHRVEGILRPLFMKED